MPTVTGKSSDDNTPGVLGESEKFNGVLGVSTANGHSGVAGVCDNGKGNGVYGRSKAANGVIGYSSATGAAGVAGANDDGEGSGVYGRSSKGAGVHGESKSFNGVLGVTTANGHSGVAGVSDSGEGNGVYGRSKNANGVVGYSSATGHSGVAGVNEDGDGPGVYGRSKKGEGIHGETMSATLAAIAAFMLNPDGIGAALHAENRGKGVGIFAKGGRLAGFFEGDVEVTGDIRLTNADCAEDFDVMEASGVEAGTVMVLSDQGALQPSHQAYDKRVAGVISGAGDYKPGIVLDKQRSQPNRKPIALLGKVFCKADASQAPIEVGDLLTTSTIPGHAMRADDPLKAFGAVIGKALRPLSNGQGLIPILIALQ